HTQSDASNCGSCGHKCGTHSHCRSGECVCNEGFIKCDGKCVTHGPNNCSGDATCGIQGETISTKGMCCLYPKVAECIAQSAPGADDGVIRCCTPGIDCWFDLGDSCPGTTFGCATGGSCQSCHACKGQNEHVITCLFAGDTCHIDANCCSGRCKT